jgi:hypothetical protein
MVDVRVRLPLGAFEIRAWESLGFRLPRAQESAGSNPAALTDSLRCGLTVRRLPVKETIAGSTPAAAVRRDKPTGDGSCLENSRAKALGVQLPLSPLTCPWPSGKGASLGHPPKVGLLNRRVRLPQSILGDRLTVGHLALNQAVEVQVLLPELGHVRACLWRQRDPG